MNEKKGKAMKTVIATALDQSLQIVFHTVSANRYDTAIRAAAKLSANGYPCSVCELDVRFKIEVL